VSPKRRSAITRVRQPDPTFVALPDASDASWPPRDVRLTGVSSSAAPSIAGTPIIETSGLVMQFPSTRALDQLDVSISSGITGLVGANGAGKTTLISLALGLLAPTAGSIAVLGLDPGRNGPELRARIGYGPERNVLPDDLRAYDFVRHLAEVKGLPRDEARSRASDSLYLVGLGEERFRALGTMSTGQRQRVKLAQAIAADPRLIVLDEPTDGLDPVQRDEMLNIIRQVNRNFGIDVVLSSHVLEEVERVCDHVVALSAGRLIAQGRLSDLAGASAGIELELVEVPDRTGVEVAVESRLTAAGARVRRDGQVFIVDGLPDDELFDVATRAVAESQARLRRLGQRRRSLDDLFSLAEESVS
jgi:ABC-2 type transport system ATP-binding protein